MNTDIKTTGDTPPCGIDPATQASQDIFDAIALDEEAEAAKHSGDQKIFSDKHKKANELRARTLKADPQAAKAMRRLIK